MGLPMEFQSCTPQASDLDLGSRVGGQMLVEVSHVGLGVSAHRSKEVSVKPIQHQAASQNLEAVAIWIWASWHKHLKSLDSELWGTSCAAPYCAGTLKARGFCRREGLSRKGSHERVMSMPLAGLHPDLQNEVGPTFGSRPSAKGCSSSIKHCSAAQLQ